MYDEVVCRRPLPGEPPRFVTDPGHVFQTKSFGCELALYEITPEGRLLEGGHPSQFSGEVTFYETNSVASKDGYCFTAAGEDAEWVEYTALFRDGELLSLTEAPTRSRSPALPVRELKSPGDRAGSDDRCDYRAGSFLGRRLFMLWGGDPVEKGEEVEVACESDRELVVRGSEGRFEVLDRLHAGGVLYGDRAAAVARLEAAASEGERRRARYAAALAKREGERRRARYAAAPAKREGAR